MVFFLLYIIYIENIFHLFQIILKIDSSQYSFFKIYCIKMSKKIDFLVYLKFILNK